MFVVVCYDIPDDRRRARAGKVLEGFGARVQKSVFECDLKDEHVRKLKEKLKRVINGEDSLRYYHLCAHCISRVETVNGPPPEKARAYFAV